MIDPIVLPTPFPVGPVNCWLLRGDPLALVDAGPSTPEALAALERGLQVHGLAIEDIELLLLTHQHSDHLGLAATIVERSGCAVAAHAELVAYAQDVQGALVAEEAWEDDLLAFHGTTAARRAGFLGVAVGRRPYGGAGVVVDRPLAEGDLVDAGSRRYRVGLRPGHSPTDTILVDDESGTAIVADHLIAHISSNPLIHRPANGSGDPALRSSAVVTYLDSLERTAAEELHVLYTGHGAAIEDHRPLIAERVRLHHARAEQVHDALAEGPQTASALSDTLWPAIDVNQTFLTLCEVLGALDLLEAAGRVQSAPVGGTLLYDRA